jgi:uncharacterized membrane protein
MSLGPIEMVVFGFSGGRIGGEVRERITDAISTNSVNLVDALFLRKEPDGAMTYRELDELTDDENVLALSNALTNGVDLLSEEDADELAANLAPGESALVLLFERAWMKPIVDAVTSSGGELLDDIPIPSVVVEEVAAAVKQLVDSDQTEE